MANEPRTDNRPYWQKLRDIKLGKVVSPEQERKDKKDALTVWFNVQASMAPANCENCKASLRSTINFHPRAHIAHIVPKTKEGGCPSVATHPLNRWFACKQCHDAYDGESAEVVATMAVIPICRERLSKFYADIAPDEVRRVPAYLLPGKELEVDEDLLPVIHVKKIEKHEPVPVKKKLKPAKKKKVNASKKEKPKRGAGGKFVSKRDNEPK